MSHIIAYMHILWSKATKKTSEIALWYATFVQVYSNKGFSPNSQKDVGNNTMWHSCTSVVATNVMIQDNNKKKDLVDDTIMT